MTSTFSPFLYYSFALQTHERDIAALKEEVKSLATELKDLRKSMLHEGAVDSAPRAVDKDTATEGAATLLIVVNAQLHQLRLRYDCVSCHAIRYHLSI